MTIQFQCPQCLSVKSAPDEQGGKLGKCKCGVYLRIPAAGSGQKVAVVEAPPTARPSPIQPFAQPPQTKPNQAELDEDTRILQSYYRADTKAREKKHEPTLYAGLADWDATLTGIIVGVMLFGPCMLWYGWAVQDFGFLTLGYIASAFWFGLIFVALFFRIDWIDVLSLCFERLGFSDLDSSEGLIRVAYILGTGATTILLLFGISWCYLFFYDGTEPNPKNAPIVRKETQPSNAGHGADKSPTDNRLTVERENEEWEKLKADFVKALATKQTSDPAQAETTQSQEIWQACVDSRTVRYTDEFLNRFGQHAELPPTSPSLRFVLQDDALYDLETKSYSQFAGRPFQLVPPVTTSSQKPIEISEDGQYQLTYVRTTGKPVENKICLQKVDNSLLRVYPDCISAQFLPGGSILLKTANGTHKIVSLSDNGTNFEFGEQRLLGLSPNRKYLALGKESSAISEIPIPSSRETVRGKTLELSIYDVNTFERVAFATYPALASVNRAFFSQDGEKLLLVSYRFCTSVSMRDGSRHSIIEKESLLEDVGWIGTGSEFLYMLPYQNSDPKGTIKVYDAELGREISRVSNDSEKFFDSLDGAYVRIRNTPENWFRLPIAKIEKTALENRELSKNNQPSKAKLQFVMDWKYSDKVKELMRDVASIHFGLEIIEHEEESTNPDKCVTLKIEIGQQRSKEIEVHIWAQTEEAGTFWYGTDHSRNNARLKDTSIEEGSNRAEVLGGIADCFNRIASKTPFMGIAAGTDDAIVSKIALKDCETFALAGQVHDFAKAEPRFVDNSWYTQRDDLETTRLPLVDYSLDTESIPTDSPPLEVVGFVNENDSPAILLYHPVLGVSSLELKANSAPVRLEDIDDFVQVQAIPGTNELLILKGKQLQLQAYGAKKKRPLILNLTSNPLQLAVAGNGKTIAVATESTVDFYDLEKFRSKPRDPKAKIFEAQYNLGDGKMALSPNGSWFAGYEKSAVENGIVLSLDSGEEQRFSADKNAMSVIIDDEGVYHLIDETAQLRKYSSSSNENGTAPNAMGSRLSELTAGALSLERKLLAFGDAKGSIEIWSYPSMTVAENLWDPGYSPKKATQGKMGWSPDGKYFYWIQGERILVWEAPPQVEDEILK